MSVLLLTGPPASGKNTVAEAIAKDMDRCAVIDTDMLRRQIVSPLRLPWEGEDGRLQQRLGIVNACVQAHNFADEGFDVIVSDTLTEAMVNQYRQHLGELALRVVLLLPTQEEITRRVISRPDYLSRGQIELLYSQQATFSGYDEKLDNTELSIADAAKWIVDHWKPAAA